MIDHSYYKTRNLIFRYDPEFPLRVNLLQPQQVTVLHQHEFCECIYVVNGRGMHQSEDHNSIPIQRGDIIAIPAGGHHAYTETDGLEIINLMFDNSRLPPVLMELYSHPAYRQVFLRNWQSFGEQDFPMTHLAESDFQKQETILRYLVQEGSSKGKHCYKLGFFMAILSHLCDVWKITSNDPPIPLDIPKLTAYMENHFQRKVYLDDLAKLAGMSRTTLLRHFREALGVTPMIYLRNLRLRYAAEQLLKTDLGLKEIADQSGFKHMPYFFTAFKAFYGVSPLEYRRKKN